MAASCTCMEDENSSFVLAGIKGNVMRYRILLTSAALVTAVMTSETLMHIDAQADEVYDGTYIMYTCNDAAGTSVNRSSSVYEKYALFFRMMKQII